MYKSKCKFRCSGLEDMFLVCMKQHASVSSCRIHVAPKIAAKRLKKSLKSRK